MEAEVDYLNYLYLSNNLIIFNGNYVRKVCTSNLAEADLVISVNKSGLSLNVWDHYLWLRKLFLNVVGDIVNVIIIFFSKPVVVLISLSNLITVRFIHLKI